MCSRYYLILFCIGLLGGAGTIMAQEVTCRVQHYGVEDGLPDHRVWSVLEHSSGFVYVGTARGLAIFDGYTCRMVRTDDEDRLLQTQSIWNLTELEDGQIAVAIGNPAMRLGGNQKLVYDPAVHSVAHLSEDVYQETIDGTAQLRSAISSPVREGFDYIRQDAYGNVFAGAVNVVDRPSEAYLTLSTGEEVDLSDEWSTMIKPSFPYGVNLGNVMYWIGHNGLIKISVRRSPFDLFLNEEVEDWEYRTVCRAMLDLNKDSILISTQIQGLFVLDRRNDRIAPVTFPGIDPAGFRAQYFRHLWSPAGADDVYGSYGTRVFRMRIREREIASAVADGPHILTAAPAGDSHCVAGRIRGTNTYFVDVIDLANGTSEKLLTVAGQELLDSARGTYLLPLADTAVWYGTKQGLFLLDIRNKEIRHLYLGKDAERRSYHVPVSFSLSGSHVWVMHYSHDGKLWVGMDGDGLNILDLHSGKVEHLSTSDGLPNNTVVGILPDSTGYWFSTFRGLAHLDTATGQFRNFFRSNGISHNEFNRYSFMIDRYGKYYFGSMNGVTSFYPKDVLEQPEELRMLLSEVSHFNRKGEEQVAQAITQNEPAQFTLPSDNRSFVVRLALSDFNHPQGNLFYYKLVPRTLWTSSEDVAWTALESKQELRFENLQAGRYRLHVKGVSAAGVPSNALTLPLKVHELFYRTWWFFSLIALAIFGALYLLHTIRLRQALRISQLRTRLSSDLHDDVGGLLSGVAFQMDALEHTVDERNKSIVRRVARSSRKAMDTMRDVVWAIDSRQDTLQDLVERMLEFSEEVLAPLGIRYTIDADHVPVKKVLPTQVRHNLLLIYKECANNTVKHAGASTLTTQFNKHGKTLEMRITDDGVGMQSKDSKTTGLGLKNMALRVQRMHGSLEFLDGPGFGVSVRVAV